MPSRSLTPNPRTVYPGRYRQHPLANRILPPYAGEVRRCTVPGCITLLNGYNPGPDCMGHTVDRAVTDAQRTAELEREAKRTRKLLARPV